MPLSNKDLTEIAKEFAATKSEISDDKSKLPEMQELVQKKQEQHDRVYIMFRDAHVERVVPYELERRWLNGITHNPITDQQINDAGSRAIDNLFFPTSWSKSNAYLTSNGNGNPRTTSSDSEDSLINGSLEQNGITALINFLRNGQGSGASSKSISSSYSPGSGTIQFNNSHGFSVGRYIYISGSGTSGLLKITGGSSTSLNVTEVIPPISTISNGGTVVENLSGFSLSERQNLSSGSYQNILNQLIAKISASIELYNTALSNQLEQLNINIDQSSQISIAKASIVSAQQGYSTWKALSSTGSKGKWTDTALNNLMASYNARSSYRTTRDSEIVEALGSVTQNSDGSYSGTGLYLQRFKTLNFLINGANGTLFQLSTMNTAKGTFEQKVSNSVDKLATISNLARYSIFMKDPVGNTVEVDGTISQFSPGDTVLITANDKPSIECTITAISGKTVTLNISIPAIYNKAAKSGLIKRV